MRVVGKAENAVHDFKIDVTITIAQI